LIGRSSPFVRSALVLVGVVIALLAIEGGVRLRQYLKYGTTGVTLNSFVRDPNTDLWMPGPLLDRKRIHLDSGGFRNPELETPKPANRIRLAFLGASTTFCAEVSSNEATWPHLVTRDLSRRYRGVTFDYVNAGVPGYIVQRSLKNLQLKVVPLQPDFIMYYEAANDFAKDSREVAARAGLYNEESDKPPGGLARVSNALYLLQKSLQIRARARREKEAGTLRYNADSLARGYEARVVAFLRAARATAPVTAVATFAHKVRREQAPDEKLRACTLSLYYMPFLTPEGILDGWDAYNRAIRAAALESGAILIEGEDSIPADDRHFFDSIHFLDPGARLQADRVVKGLVASPEFNRLVASRGGQPAD
jgi:lysophospholipase L1-like esterase